MRSLAAPLALALAVLAPAAAHADGASFTGQMTIGGGSTAGEIGGELDMMNLPLMSLGLGFRTRNVGLFGVGDMLAFDAHDETVDSRGLISFGAGVEVAGYLPLGHGWEAYGRAGKRWRWLGGDNEVTRTCNQTGTCAGGFWPETPSYTSSGLTGAIGLQWTFADKGAAGAVGLELHVEQVVMDLPGRGTVGGTLVVLGLNFMLGTSGYRR
jgi:hypothetical protein